MSLTPTKGPPPIIYILVLACVGGLIWFFLFRDASSGQAPQPTGTGIANRDPNPAQIPTSQAAETFRAVTGVPTGVFNYGGSTTWAPIRLKVDPVIQKVWPEFGLRYTDPIVGNPGSGTGIGMLLDNQLSFSQSSRSVKPEEYEEARARGFEIQEIPVAIDGIAVAVNPNLPVDGITVDQLRRIYLGEITNWQHVGGPRLPITPYSRDPNAGGTVDFFIENVLADQPLSPTVVITPTTTLSLREVAQDPGGIYYASAPEVIPQCTVKAIAIGRRPEELISPYAGAYIPPEGCPAQRNQLNIVAFREGDYPITRRLFVIVKRNGQIDEQAGMAYVNLMLSDQGQELSQSAGFVPIQ